MSLDVSKLNQEDLAALAGLLSKMGTPAEASKPRRRRGAPSPVKYLTEEEVQRLFAVIKSPRDYAIFRLAYHRGLRAREIGRLQLSDYRPREERIQVFRLKGSRSGEFHLTKNEVKALRRWLAVRGDRPGPLFPSSRGKGISQQMLDVLMKRYGAAAGIPEEKRHMHALKHSCGTHLLARGENIEDVRDHLGHVNIQNTLIYAQITNTRREERDRRLRDW
jgi:type 1 fimbriae regulatory protein FimB